MARAKKLPYAVPLAGPYGKVRTYRPKLAFLLGSAHESYSARPWERVLDGRRKGRRNGPANLQLWPTVAASGIQCSLFSASRGLARRLVGKGGHP
jgi:hypothetical protein